MNEIKEKLLVQFDLLAERSKRREVDIYEATCAMCEIAKYFDECDMRLIKQSADRIRSPWYLRWMNFR